MPLLIERKGPVGILTLSRPDARNAWDEDYNQDMPRILSEWEDDDGIRCVILTGDERGGAFSAGANLKDPNTHSTASAAEFIKALPKWRSFPVNLVQDFPKPVIAAVNGFAIGIGCIITYACDLIVASDRAEWRLPQAALGILPAYGGTPRLVQWVGKGLAMKTAMGFPIQAEEAYRIGLAQWLVSHDKLMDQAMAVADHIAGLPPLAARLVKESVNKGLDIPNIKDAALADVYRFFALELTEDKEEGHQAWRDRRKPVFHGR
jgi:enoyl-CoA hydratase/carnithine racemase